LSVKPGAFLPSIKGNLAKFQQCRRPATPSLIYHTRGRWSHRDPVEYTPCACSVVRIWGDTFIGAVGVSVSEIPENVWRMGRRSSSCGCGCGCPCGSLWVNNVRWGVFPYLDKSNVGALLPEALTADVQAVLADETSGVGADTAVGCSCQPISQKFVMPSVSIIRHPIRTCSLLQYSIPKRTKRPMYRGKGKRTSCESPCRRCAGASTRPIRETCCAVVCGVGLGINRGYLLSAQVLSILFDEKYAQE
jgi:hypothetical protein